MLKITKYGHTGVFAPLVLVFGLSCLHAQTLVLHSPPEPLSVAVNSPLDETSVIISHDGKQLYFTRTHHPDNKAGLADRGDIWYSVRKPNGQWGSVHNLPYPLNTEVGSLLIGLANKDNKMYLFNEEERLVGFKRRVYTSIRDRYGNWQAPAPLLIPYYNDRSPHPSGWIAPNDKVLILALDAYGTYGVEDLYVVHFDTKTQSWTPLQNLGRQINTEWQEMYPFMTRDTRVLVFSSNRKGGNGSWDFYYTQRKDDTWREWSQPKPIKALNTPAAELAFFYKEKHKKAFFARTESSRNYSNLYTVGLHLEASDEPLLSEEAQTPVDSVIQSIQALTDYALPAFALQDQSSGASIDGQISLNTHQPPWDTTLFISAQKEPLAQLVILAFEPKQMSLTASAKGYFTHTQTLEPLKKAPTYAIPLKPIETGKHVRLSHVFFKKGSAVFMPESEVGLQTILMTLRQNPDLALYLEGHTDNQGRFEDNLALSQARVAAIIQYLNQRGIQKERLQGKGYGSTRPIASNLNETDRQRNRRVEFILKRMLKENNDQ